MPRTVQRRKLEENGIEVSKKLRQGQTQVHGLLSRATAARPCLKVWAVTVLCPLALGKE